LNKTIALSIALAASLTAATAQQPLTHHTPSTRDFFYVGGKYANDVMEGQMYVEALRPARVTQKYPIVFFHGLAQTATNWMGTPDGRPGWADYFLAQGYLVYLVDQPARGRSAWHPNLNGQLQIFGAPEVERRFTASESAGGTWPQQRNTRNGRATALTRAAAAIPCSTPSMPRRSKVSPAMSKPRH
jgi:pimeloyl-ACP methyl ester carboxylesterase